MVVSNTFKKVLAIPIPILSRYCWTNTNTWIWKKLY